MVFGDSLAATAWALAHGYDKIDKNILSTSDFVPVVNHSPDLTSFLGGRFNYRYEKVWGEGKPTLDPRRDTPLGHRPWSEIALVTDVTGTQRIRTYEEHVADGIKKGVMQIPEGKPQAKLEDPKFWRNVAEAQARHGHPRVMMTLTQYGHPWLRAKAAKQGGIERVALLPRGKRPADFDQNYRPWVDALWGAEWGTL